MEKKLKLYEGNWEVLRYDGCGTGEFYTCALLPE